LPPAEGFAALSALPREAKQRLFAWCIAAALNGQLAIEDRANPVLECLGQRLAIPFADYWRPTAANYWGRAKKAYGLAVADAILGARWVRDHADDNKPALATALERAFDRMTRSECMGLDRAAQDGAAVWLPPGMAYADALADHGETGNAVSETTGDSCDDEPTDAVKGSDLPAFLITEEPDHVGLNGPTPV
jgi:ParB family transcriptional regulator, chromosome partitioning protein